MHKRITFVGASGPISALADEVRPLEGVITLEHQRGTALKPPGDVLTVDVLNRSADDVLRRAHLRAKSPGVRLTVVVMQSTAVVDGERQHLLEKDADEMLWEEMEAGLRNHGRVSANYVLLMSLGGIIAAAALPLETTSQTIGFVAASIIAPAFEPVAKVAQGLVLRQWSVVGRALLSIAVGYSVLFLAALATALVLFHLRTVEVGTFLEQPVLDSLSRFHIAPLLSSAAAAVAGILMVVSLRDFYVVGPLMALVMIPGVALTAAGLAIGEEDLAFGALRRVGVDLALVVVLGAAVFTWKQRRVHRRSPLT
jgi:hypothetical protein